jgi:hypothetical protein
VPVVEREKIVMVFSWNEIEPGRLHLLLQANDFQLADLVSRQVYFANERISRGIGDTDKEVAVG